MFSNKKKLLLWFQVFKFFQDRIEMQYPLDAEGEEDIYQKRHEGHESFMKAKADAVLGRGELLDKVGRKDEGDQALSWNPVLQSSVCDPIGILYLSSYSAKSVL